MYLRDGRKERQTDVRLDVLTRSRLDKTPRILTSNPKQYCAK